jgi:hypothetical protein
MATLKVTFDALLVGIGCDAIVGIGFDAGSFERFDLIYLVGVRD